MNSSLEEKCFSALNRITKWRTVFAGWQLGTRSKSDPECQAVKDHRELSILTRLEISAFTKLLVQKGIITVEEFQEAMIEEADLLEKDYERKFPGIKAADDGITYDRRAIETMRNWKP